MKTQTLENSKVVYDSGGIIGKVMLNNEKNEIIYLTMEPGKQLASHKLPIDVTFFVLKGKGLFTIGETTKELSENMIAESPANISKGIENRSDTTLHFLAIKSL